MLKAACIAAATIGLLGLAACDGSAEKTGENLDSAVENATQGHKNMGDGAMEKAGEQVDKMTGQKDNDPADALHDATDGDSSTKP